MYCENIKIYFDPTFVRTVSVA